MLTGSWDQEVVVWDAVTAEPLSNFLGHEAAVSSVAFSPDGLRVLSLDEDGVALAWDRETGAVISRSTLDDPEFSTLRRDADIKLPGRARSLKVTGATVRAIGDDGSILEANITPQGLANARLFPADPRLALGPAVGWQVPAPVGSEVDVAACTALAQRIQTLRNTAARDQSRVASTQQFRGRVQQLDAAQRLFLEFTERCPGLSVDTLAAPMEAADADPPQCAPFAQAWAALAPEQRQAQRDALLARVPGACTRLRAEIGAVQSGSVAVGAVEVSTATPAGTIFRDRAEGVPESALPEMVVIPAGSFLMGSPDSEPGRFDDEGPQRRVTIGQPFAVGRFEVTFDEWAACVAGGGCTSNSNPDDRGWGRGRRPVINVSWNDAQEYVQWLSRRTGQRYRLLTEAEWEYAARAGTTTAYSTGDAMTESQARFNANSTVGVGSFPANRFGLYDMHGNVWEWRQDCFAESYASLPTNGAANTTQGCSTRVSRGGSWDNNPQNLRSAIRYWNTPALRDNGIGFRVARTL